VEALLRAPGLHHFADRLQEEQLVKKAALSIKGRDPVEEMLQADPKQESWNTKKTDGALGNPLHADDPSPVMVGPRLKIFPFGAALLNRMVNSRLGRVEKSLLGLQEPTAIFRIFTAEQIAHPAQIRTEGPILSEYLAAVSHVGADRSGL